MMKYWHYGAAMALALLATAATAQTDPNAVAQLPTTQFKPVATATSPDRSIVVTIAFDNDGRPTYAVTRKGKPVLQPGKLGVMFTDAPKIERNMTLIGQSQASADSSWTQPFGEWKSIRDRHNELTLRFREKAGMQREMDVIFRVSIPSAERTALLIQCTGLLYTPDREHFGIVPIEVIFHPRCLHTFLFLLSIT